MSSNVFPKDVMFEESEINERPVFANVQDDFVTMSKKMILMFMIM